MGTEHPHSTTTSPAPSKYPGASMLASTRALLRSAVPAVLIGTTVQVTEFLDLGKTPDRPIDDRKLAFSNGIKFMSKEGASSKWTAPLQATALALLHDPERILPGSAKAEYVQRLPVGPVPSKDCETVFHELLEAPSGPQRKKHPRDISSLFYAYLCLISLCIYRTSLQDKKRNDASPYLDLSPLYGCTPEETEKIRLLDGRGMLAPDCFVDDRPSLLPPAVSALLVLWNRNHNFIARSLFVRSGVGKQWVHHEDLSTAQCKKQDDEIFELAQQINSILFRNTIGEDVLKILLGLSSFEPSANLDVLANIDSRPKGKGMDSYIESSFLYHWNPMMSPSDVDVLEESILEIAGRTKDLRPKDFRDLHQQFKADNFNDDLTTHNYPRLIRDARTGYFQDEDLANIILDASEDTACAPGSHQIPPILRTFELEILEEGRAQKVCTFNEFRQLYGLNALPSFTAWNPDPEISQAAENLYGSIDRLELYPGLQAEAAIPNGLGLGYTQTYALIVDLVTRCRTDPSVLKQNEDSLTAWGMSQTLVDRTGVGYGAVLPKLLQRTLPRFYSFNNMYTLFPFAVPSTFPKASTDTQDALSDFTYEKPTMKKTHVLDNLDAIKYVFRNPEIYQNPYSRGLTKVTNGYGYMLGFENALEHLHDQDQLMTMYALIPDAGSLSRYGATFGKMTEDAIKRHRRTKDGKTRIDIVGDVINEVCTRWVCETLCDYELADGQSATPSRRSSARKSTAKSGQEGQKTAKEMHKEFAALYTLIFRSFDQEDGWDAQRRAIESSKRLRVHIENKIPKPKWLLSQSYNIEWLTKVAAELKEFCWDLVEIYFFQKVLPASTAQTFLERVVQASRSISLPKIHTVPHLHEKLQAKKNSTQKDQDNLEREIEVSRIVANILGLAAVTAVNYSQACAQVVDFYLQDEYQTERAEIIRLSNEVPKSDEKRRELNAEIAKYIHEALRISQPLGLWREAIKDDEIKFLNGAISVREGDLIFADFHQAHNDSMAFPNPDAVDITRPKVKSLLGVGIHRCPAFSFIDNTMPEVIRMIFQLPNLSRVQSSAHSRLNMVHIHPQSTQMDPKAFVSEQGEVAYYPQTMILEYDDPSSSENIDEKEKVFAKTWEAGQVPNPLRTITKKSEQGLAISFILFILYKVILVLLGIWALVMLFFFGPLARRPVKVATVADIQHINVECPEPITTWEPWSIATLPAGNDSGIPQDLVYTTSLATAHRLQLYDADKKDMRMAVHVDDILRGLTSDFELNREEDCGDDVYQCYAKQYSGGVVVIPPGNHTVRIAWAGKEFINETIPDLGENTARRILWNRDYCGPPV